MNAASLISGLHSPPSGLYIAACIGICLGNSIYVRNNTVNLEAEVAAAVTFEQQDRQFGLDVEYEAISRARTKLLRFKSHTLNIRALLEAIKEDKLAEFNPEDVKRLEKEVSDFRRRKGESLLSVCTAISVLLGQMAVVLLKA